jgi:DNA-binding PadR family transcriptional regulator
MALPELLLSVLRAGPAHGYDIKRIHDEWFPDSRPLAYGQVYATLARLEKGGLVAIAETRVDGGPERTVYALGESGEQRLAAWLAEPADVASVRADEIVRKTVAALRSGGDAGPFLARQRTAHLRRIRELAGGVPGADPVARLARDHLIAHLDADLRWLDTAAERLANTHADPEAAR